MSYLKDLCSKDNHPQKLELCDKLDHYNVLDKQSKRNLNELIYTACQTRILDLDHLEEYDAEIIYKLVLLSCELKEVPNNLRM